MLSSFHTLNAKCTQALTKATPLTPPGAFFLAAGLELPGLPLAFPSFSGFLAGLSSMSLIMRAFARENGSAAV